MPVLVVCYKCKKSVDIKRTALCSVCNFRFEPDCDGYPAQTYKLMDKESKNKWRCRTCIIKMATSPTHMSQENVLSSPTTICNTSIDNVTFRHKTCKTTFLTENSFEALSELSENEDEHASFNSTTSYVMNRSYPELHRPNDDIDELKSKICKLEENLKIAENEIERLLLENSTQAEQINDYKLTVNKLKHVCTSTFKKKPITKSKRNSLVRSKLDFLSTQESPNQKTELNKTSSSPQTCTKLEYCRDQKLIDDTQKSPKLVSYLETEGATVSQVKQDLANYNHRKIIMGNINRTYSKICIVSENNVNSILETAEHVFPNNKICHYCLPNAGVTELLSGLGLKLVNYTLKDYCIILLGERDFVVSKNYATLVNHIKCKLEKITHTNVILCSPNFKLNGSEMLFNNRIEAFNQLLYLSNKRFEYTYTFDTNKYLKYTYDMFFKFTGKVNNIGMGKIFHKLKNYIHYLNIFYENNYMTEDTTHIQNCNKISQGQPGTIPYYFKKLADNKSNGHCNESETLSHPCPSSIDTCSSTVASQNPNIDNTSTTQASKELFRV